MSGYNYAEGMSNRAVMAYNDGLIPLSKLTAKHLKEVGWKGTLKQAKELAKKDVWLPSEWHHSGGTWYNKVYFYDPQDLVDLEIEPLAKEDNEEKSYLVKGSYEEFIRQGRRTRHCGTVQFTGQLKGDWIHIDGGGRKKASGNHITYQYLGDDTYWRKGK